MSSTMMYEVARSSCGLPPPWDTLHAIPIDQFHPASSSHRPDARVKLCHDGQHLFVRFDVHDRFVRCVNTDRQSDVCLDSCVEFFVQPGADQGYFNFESNCGGTLLLHHIRTPRVDFEVLPIAALDQIYVTASLPPVVDPEIADWVDWSIEMTIPFSFFERYLGTTRPGGVWRANFYKCADHTSHPHWASWSPIGEKLDFHQANRFGELRFAE